MKKKFVLFKSSEDTSLQYLTTMFHGISPPWSLKYLLSYSAPAGEIFVLSHTKEIRKAGRDACTSVEINFPQYEKPPTGRVRSFRDIPLCWDPRDILSEDSGRRSPRKKTEPPFVVSRCRAWERGAKARLVSVAVAAARYMVPSRPFC